MNPARTIRVVAVCVFRTGTRILVGRGFDDVKGEEFFRPLGGQVEFGESFEEALRREMREELRVEITDVVRLGTLENVFTHMGEPGHEVVVVFDARLGDDSLYDLPSIPLFEEIWGGEARWLHLDQALAAPLYPDGLLDLLNGHRGATVADASSIPRPSHHGSL